MQWERLVQIRTLVLALAGLVALCVGGFMFLPVVGWAVLGVSLLLLAYLTDPSAAQQGARR